MNTEIYSADLMPKPVKPEDFTPDQIAVIMKYVSDDRKLAFSRAALIAFVNTLISEAARLNGVISRQAELLAQLRTEAETLLRERDEAEANLKELTSGVMNLKANHE